MTNIIGLIILLGSVFLARSINAKATQKLTMEKKAQLVDLFAARRPLTIIILIAIVVLYLVMLKVSWADPFVVFVVYAITILFSIIFMGFNAHRKLTAYEFPESFIRAHILSTSLRFVGVIIFFSLMWSR